MCLLPAPGSTYSTVLSLGTVNYSSFMTVLSSFSTVLSCFLLLPRSTSLRVPVPAQCFWQKGVKSGKRH